MSLALARPTQPERFLLGIELDGGFYRAAPAVIDREIVREGVMDSLGWKVVRVSSLDFLRDPSGVINRVHQLAAAAS